MLARPEDSASDQQNFKPALYLADTFHIEQCRYFLDEQTNEVLVLQRDLSCVPFAELMAKSKTMTTVLEDDEDILVEPSGLCCRGCGEPQKSQAAFWTHKILCTVLQEYLKDELDISSTGDSSKHIVDRIALQSEAFVSKVKRNQVYCIACDKWVILSMEELYSVRQWQRHMTSEHEDTESEESDSTMNVPRKNSKSKILEKKREADSDSDCIVVCKPSEKTREFSKVTSADKKDPPSGPLVRKESKRRASEAAGPKNYTFIDCSTPGPSGHSAKSASARTRRGSVAFTEAKSDSLAGGKRKHTEADDKDNQARKAARLGDFEHDVPGDRVSRLHVYTYEFQ